MRLFTVLMSGLALGACASGSGGSSSPSPSGGAVAAGAPASSNGPTFTAALQPAASTGTRIVGSLKLIPTAPGEYRAELSIRNAGGMQNKYPWIIKTGQCGETSARELGNPVAYRMLETGSDGSARINASVKVPLTASGVYHVDILKSPTERDAVVSCGVLSIM